jgi:hypothetical protein
VSKRKDPSKELVFKNQFNNYESNHVLVLSLANGETAEVEVNEFNKHYMSSDKIVAKDMNDEFIYNETLSSVR